MDGFAKGVLKILPSDLAHYSVMDLYDAYTGYWQAHTLKERAEWERARWIAFYASAGKLKGVNKATDIYTFDWERKRYHRGSKENPYSVEEARKIMQRHKQMGK